MRRFLIEFLIHKLDWVGTCISVSNSRLVASLSILKYMSLCKVLKILGSFILLAIVIPMLAWLTLPQGISNESVAELRFEQGVSVHLHLTVL